MNKSVEVSYRGIDFTVEGNYEKGYAATWMEPGEPDGFDDYAIFIEGVDVTDVLAESVVDGIIEKATEYCKDMDSGRYDEPDED